MSALTQEMNLFAMARMTLTLAPGAGFLFYLYAGTLFMRPDILDVENRITDIPAHKIRDYYDFIIIGGGSAGTVLANRLSENPYWNILLLEAGPDEIAITDMPLMFPTLQLSPLDWQYKTEPGENYCQGFKEKRCNWPRGKVLGGCSVLNAMMYVRGNKKDYDRWRDLGNPGWGYEDVLPYFKKSEDMRIPEFVNDEYHGTGGYLTVEHYRYRSPIAEWYLQAAQELGYDIRDINGKNQTGFSLAHGTIRDGLRCSTAKAFIRPASKRKNLHVSLHSMVYKVLINEKNNQAYGVILKKFGIEKTVNAQREIILSAGALQSPQLLMLSGVGPKEHLQEMGIKVIKHSPGVGYNLQDHAAIGGATYIFDKPPEYGNNVTLTFQLPSIFTTESINDFTQNHKGPIYWLPVCEVMGFVSTKYQDPNADWPDIQLFLTSYADSSDGGLYGRRAVGLTDEFYAAVYEEIIYKEAFNIVPLLMRPKSRGRIMLRDKDPESKVVIYPNYFSIEDDIKVIVEGMKIGHKVVMTQVMQKYNITFNPYRIPACKDFELFSDEYWTCHAKEYTLTIYHPSGTAKMGPDSDPNAVVDPHLKVKGIRNLRLVDASIFPYITTGNTNAPVIMVAEKAADIIKEDWGVLDRYLISEEDENNIPEVDKLGMPTPEKTKENTMQKIPVKPNLDYW